MGSIEGAQPAHGGTRSSVGGEAQRGMRLTAMRHSPRLLTARGGGAEPSPMPSWP